MQLAAEGGSVQPLALSGPLITAQPLTGADVTVVRTGHQGGADAPSAEAGVGLDMIDSAPVPQCPSAPVRDERVGFPTPPEPDGGNKFPSTIARGDSPVPIRWSRYRFSSGSHDPVIVGTNREDGVQDCQRKAIGIATTRRCPRLRRSQVGGGIGMERAHLRPSDTTHSHRRHGLTVGRRGYRSELRPVTARLTSAAVPGTGRPLTPGRGGRSAIDTLVDPVRMR